MAYNDNLIPRPLAWEWAKPRVDTERYPVGIVLSTEEIDAAVDALLASLKTTLVDLIEQARRG